MYGRKCGCPITSSTITDVGGSSYLLSLLCWYFHLLASLPTTLLPRLLQIRTTTLHTLLHALGSLIALDTVQIYLQPGLLTRIRPSNAATDLQFCSG